MRPLDTSRDPPWAARQAHPRCEDAGRTNTGVVIPNAKVITTHDATRQNTETTTNPSEEFVSGATARHVTLNVEAAGFSKGLVTGLERERRGQRLAGDHAASGANN